MPGEKTLTRFFDTLKTRPVLFSLLLAFILYLALVITTLIWLALHAEDTTQRRIAQSPSITVIIKKPDTAESQTHDSDPSQNDSVIEAPPADAPPASWDTEKPDTEPKDTESKEPEQNTETPTPDKQADSAAASQASEAETPHQETQAEQKAHWQTLARAFNPDDPRPRIAVIITDLGVIQSISEQAINQLPADVTLSFQAVAPHIQTWLDKSRKAGHENLLAIPMEPLRYPQNDPGPNTLLTVLSEQDNAQRLQQSLRLKTHALGVMPAQGEAFITHSKALSPVITTLKEEGLIFVDATRQKDSAAESLSRLARLPFLSTSHVIDATQLSRKDMATQFAQIERDAAQNGSALVAILPYPIAIEQTQKWLKSFPEKNLLLAPVSALIPPAPATETDAQKTP